MKVETTERNILRSNSFEEKAMGLAAGSEAFVFNVLRKDLYSDPIGSLIREYTVNAQDEHRKHGKTDVPIQIQVPNSFTPELRIRDFAEGLTEEQVFNFFGNYGASDKRDSNVAVGFFGLGCKSAFAYTDSYIVKSFKNGKCFTFNIYIDETEIGKTAKIAEEATDEPNGVEIIVPVQTKDINTFQTKVVETVSHFKTTPVITGMDFDYDFELGTPIIEGEGWKYFGSGSPKMVMGEIAYPINHYGIENLETWERLILDSNILIYVNIGDVQVTASREALQMTDKTVQLLREKLLLVKNAMIAETEKRFEECENLIEAKRLYNTMVERGGGFASVIRNANVGLIWNGQVINNSYIKIPNDSVHYVIHYAEKRKGGVKTSPTRLMVCKNDLYFDDVVATTAISRTRRAKTLFDSGVREFYLVSTTNKADLEIVLGTPIKALQSFESVAQTLPTRITGQGAGVDETKRIKHLSKIFVLNTDKLRGYYGASSEVWETQEVDVNSLRGVYVTIDRFKPTNSRNFHDLDSLSLAFSRLRKAGIKINIPIYGVKKGADVGKLIPLDTWIDYKIRRNETLLENKRVADAFQKGIYEIKDVTKLNLKKLPATSFAKQYATTYRKYHKVHKLVANKELHQVFRYTKTEIEPETTLENLHTEFVTKYPMLKFVNTSDYGSDEIIDYIAEQDRKSETALPA